VQSFRELEALLALCQAASLVHDRDGADQLLLQLSLHLPDIHSQAFAPSPFLWTLEPSPWEVVTQCLASSILSLGLNNPSLRHKVVGAINAYVEKWSDYARFLVTSQSEGEVWDEPVVEGKIVGTLVLVSSLLGFFEAATQHTHLWTSQERLALIRVIKAALSGRFMTVLETGLSIIRNSKSQQRQVKEWRQYLKHYAAISRPLGAMLVQEGFMKLVRCSVSLLVVEPSDLHGRDVLLALSEKHSLLEIRTIRVADDVLGLYADIAADQMKLLEDESDFLRIGSAWQQRLAFTVKADALKTFLCCALLNEEIADPDILMATLQNSLEDAVQMADRNMSKVVLRTLTVLAKTSNAVASGLSKSLPRLIVQGGLTQETASEAADCLAIVLRTLPQDAVISTLYSLGNVVSAKSGADGAFTSSPVNDISTKGTRSSEPYSQRPAGSSISLSLSDPEETSVVYGVVLRTITRIANSFKDEKIIALAQSIIIQKIGKVGVPVDAAIIIETAMLGSNSGANEFRSLLRLYVKICRDAMLQENSAIVQAVGKSFRTLSCT
jgi:phosphatidylinositol 4-kinase A